MDQKVVDELCRLWEGIGGIKAWADPDGPIASGTFGPASPEERLAAIWEIVKDLSPQT